MTQLKVFISFCWDLSWFTVLLLALNKTATLSLALVEIWGSALCCGMEAAREKLSHSRNWNWSMEINCHIRMLSITFEFIVYKLSWDNMWRQKTMISNRIFPFLFSKTVTVITQHWIENNKIYYFKSIKCLKEINLSIISLHECLLFTHPLSNSVSCQSRLVSLFWCVDPGLQINIPKYLARKGNIPR